MYPSLTTPPKGSTVQRVLSAGTTSRCATSSSAFEGSAIAALRRRATTALRPGMISRISGVKPSFCNTAATYFAAGASPPGGFEVFILIKSVSQPCASWAKAAVPVGCGGTAVSGRFGGVFGGIPGPLTGDCAKSGEAARRDPVHSATTHAKTPSPTHFVTLLRAGADFRHTCIPQFTSPPSLLAAALGSTRGKIIPANVLQGMCFILARGYSGLAGGNSQTLRNFNWLFGFYLGRWPSEFGQPIYRVKIIWSLRT